MRPAVKSTATKRIKCASCKKVIRADEPDLVLEKLSGDSKARYFHERCGGAAYELALERPTVYLLTVRHAETARN